MKGYRARKGYSVSELYEFRSPENCISGMYLKGLVLSYRVVFGILVPRATSADSSSK